MTDCDYRGIFMLGFMAGGLLAAWIGALWDVIMGEGKRI
jgi:hypothetical protein